MLGIDPEKVRHIVAKARSADVKGEVRDPSPESTPPDDRVRQELAGLIRALGEDEQIELIALCWVGRGTYGADEWDEALSEARAALSERTAEYLIQLPSLADYLVEGLAAHGNV